VGSRRPFGRGRGLESPFQSDPRFFGALAVGIFSGLGPPISVGKRCLGNVAESGKGDLRVVERLTTAAAVFDMFSKCGLSRTVELAEK